jgi:predicted nuclease with TOPRIM domain
VAAKGQSHSAMVVSSPDLESLYKILTEYAKKSEFGDYTLKSDRDDILRRVVKLEKKTEEQQQKVESLEKWEPAWGKLQQDVVRLDDLKADKSALEDAIERMKGIIAQMNPGSTEVIAQAFDSSDLKEAIKRLT